MKVLCIGDIVGNIGVDYLCRILPKLRQDLRAELVIVNAENSDKSGVGLSKNTAEFLLGYVDVITTGNHCYRKTDENLYLDEERVLHPINLMYTEDTSGMCHIDMGKHGIITIINLMGMAWMPSVDSPYKRVDEILQKNSSNYTIIDFHAEATAEKKAFAYYLDGRVSALFGTHTHVPTADIQILPNGTGYITDVGMVGPIQSVLGVEPELAIKKQKYGTPTHFKVAEGACTFNAALFTLDKSTGLCSQAEQVIINQN